MEFKTKSALAQHFAELERKEYVIGEWITTHYNNDKNEPMTKATRVFKINFARIDKNG